MQEEQTSWSSTVSSSIAFLPVKRRHQNLCRGFTLLVHALSIDEHINSPARMRYSKFVHYVQNYRDRHRTEVWWVPKFHGGFKLSPLFH